jgi:hypothetical protein
MAFMFEKLEVYQKAVDFADEIAALTEAFPRGYGFLADQLNRAALSIPADLAQSNARLRKPDHRDLFTIARRSGQPPVPLPPNLGTGRDHPARLIGSGRACRGS